MIKYLKQSEIDYKKWDDCISNSINCMVYPYSWYLDIVAGKWDALVEGDYRSVMPIPFKKKFGILKIYQPFFTQQLGVFSKDIISDPLVKSFINHIPGKFLFQDINLNWLNKFQDNSYLTEQRRTFLLDLISPYDDLKTDYSQNCKRNINKALKNGVFIVEEKSHDDIINAFKDNRGNLFPEIKKHHYKKLIHLINTGIQKRIIQVIKAYNDKNTFCAGVVFFIHNKRAVFVFSGATPEARNNGAMFAILDYFIQKHQQTDMTLDFEGSMDENLARFYAGFGAKECLFLRIKKKCFVF